MKKTRISLLSIISMLSIVFKRHKKASGFKKQRSSIPQKAKSITISVDERLLSIAKLGLVELLSTYLPNDTTHKKAEAYDIILQTFLAGERAKSLGQKLAGKLSINEETSQAIASHTLKFLFAKYHQAKAEDIGLTKYRWSQSHKGCHDKLYKRTFSYSHPPVAGKNGVRANPGELPGCTCMAIGIVD